MISNAEWIFAVGMLAGCSDLYLDQAEQIVPVERNTEQSLADLSKTAGKLADTYMKAARKTQNAQDALSFVTVTSAVAAIGGVVAESATTDIAGAAIVGTASQQTASRFNSKPAISAILDGAKRMNCVSAVAGYGEEMFSDAGERKAAAIATVWAIYQVRILTRDKITRDPAQFAGLFNEFKANVGTVIKPLAETAKNRALRLSGTSFRDGSDLAVFLGMIDKCASSEKPDKAPGAENPT